MVLTRIIKSLGRTVQHSNKHDVEKVTALPANHRLDVSGDLEGLNAGSRAGTERLKDSQGQSHV